MPESERPNHIASERRRRLTQADVARHVGVSQALVSYVVNGNEGISIPPETRARIVEAIRELGYVPNTPARTLRTNKTYAIAAIVPDISNPFYPAFIRGVQDVAGAHQYHVITCNTDGDAGREAKCIRFAMQGNVDGVVAVLFHQGARSLFALLDLGLAVVRMEATAKPAGERPLDNLYVDNTAAAAEAVTHLIERGHRDIGLLARDIGPGQARTAGYLRALRRHGIEPFPQRIHHCEYTVQSGYQGAEALLRSSPCLTAIFAGNDMMAIGALAAIQNAGLRVPEDMAVVGFDDTPTAELVSPSLTTVTQFQKEQGQRAAELLLDRLEQRAPPHGRSEEMPYKLIIRNST